MSQGSIARKALAAGFILFLLIPYLFMLSELSFSSRIDWDEFLWVAKNTFIQSFFSAFAGTLLGFAVALGSMKIQSHRNIQIFESLCLIPYYIPTLFFVISVLQVWPAFPRGLWGIVIMHVLLNFGLAAQMIRDGILNKAGPSADLAATLGSSKLQYYRKILVPLLRADLLISFSFLFITAFLSFSIPLLVGGQQIGSFEVMIYEIIRHQTDWSSAVFISLLQSLFLGAVFFTFLRPSILERKERFHSSSWIGIPLLWTLAALPLLITLTGYLAVLFESHFLLHLNEVVSRPLLAPLLNTTFLALFSTLFSLFLNCLAGYLYFSTHLSFFVRFYLGPTSALVGFGVLIWGNRLSMPEFLQLTIAYLFVFHLFFLRNILFPRLSELKKQHELAQVLGVREMDFFQKISLPTILPSLFQSCGLFAIWVMGDFALTNMIAKDYVTLAQLIERLTQNYRFDQALILSTLLGGLIFGVYHVIQRTGHVIHQKIYQKL